MTSSLRSLQTAVIRRAIYHLNLKKEFCAYNLPNFIYCSAPEGTVIKGFIAKRIPAFVDLKKDKTYSWCSCGLSKKQPFCDGSHKNHPQKLQPVHFNPPKDGRYLMCRCKQTNNRPYCDLTHIKTFIPEGLRKALKIKL